MGKTGRWSWALPCQLTIFVAQITFYLIDCERGILWWRSKTACSQLPHGSTGTGDPQNFAKYFTSILCMIFEYGFKCAYGYVCMCSRSDVFVLQRPKFLSSLFFSLSEPIHQAWFENVNSYQYLWKLKLVHKSGKLVCTTWQKYPLLIVTML